MPQLSLLRGGVRSQCSWTYTVDPTKPDNEPLLYCQVGGPRTISVEHVLVTPRLNVIHEEVTEFLAATWEAYLFGEPDDVRKAGVAVHRRWEKESKLRRAV